MNMHTSAHRMPGMYPPTKSPAIEVAETSEYTIIRLLGGMIIPEGAEAMFVAAAKLRS